MLAKRTSAAWTVIIVALLVALVAELYVQPLRSGEVVLRFAEIDNALAHAPSFLHSFAFALLLGAFARTHQGLLVGLFFVILCEIAAEFISIRIWPAGSITGSWEYWRATFDWNDIIAAVVGSLGGSGLIVLVEVK